MFLSVNVHCLLLFLKFKSCTLTTRTLFYLTNIMCLLLSASLLYTKCSPVCSFLECDTARCGVQNMRLLGVSSLGCDTVSVRCVVPSSSGSRNASCHNAAAYTFIICVCYLERVFCDILSRRWWFCSPDLNLCSQSLHVGHIKVSRL